MRPYQNLAFFLEHGVRPALANPRYHFSILLTGNKTETPPLPPGGSRSLTPHNMNGSSGFEAANFKRFFNIRWCARAAALPHDCTPCAPGAPASVAVDQFQFFVMIADTVLGG